MRVSIYAFYDTTGGVFEMNNAEFYRDFVVDLENFLKGPYNVLFLLGPRKCGKTVALHQIHKRFPTSKLYDFKAGSTSTVIAEIKDAILSQKRDIFLLDEITYLDGADRELAELSNAFDFCLQSNVKIIITGSQSVALRTWGHRAFSATAQYLQVPFLKYSEWLRYKNLKSSENAFMDFVMHSWDFYKLDSLKEYLQSCLDETIISNSKSLNVIFDNDCDSLTPELLIAVMYTVMYTLHNHFSYPNFRKSTRLEDDLHYWFTEVDMDEKAYANFTSHYSLLKSISFDVFRRAVLFLLKSDLITITYFSRGIDDQIDILGELTTRNPSIKNLDEFFVYFNICIKYPMFYLAVLKELIRPQRTDVDFKINGAILGSIVECYVRGLLGKQSYEYHDLNDSEIDYVDYSTYTAVEFTISNKRMSKTHFDKLSGDWLCVLLSKDRTDKKSGIYEIPYYVFVEKLEQNVDLRDVVLTFQIINSTNNLTSF